LGAGFWRSRCFVVAWTCSDRICPRATVVAPCPVPLAVLAARRSAAEELRVCLVAADPQSANAVAPPLPTSRPAARNHAPAAIRLREEVKSSLPPPTTVGPQIRQSWNCGMKLRHKMHRCASTCRRCRPSSCCQLPPPTRSTPPSATMRRTSTMAAARSSECRQLGSGCRRKGTGGRRIKGLLQCQPSIRWARRGIRRRPFGRRKLTRTSMD
jgi:hypothetical protein